MAAVHSALAPASTSTAGVRPRRGRGVAMHGRTTPGRRPIRSSAEAIVAPVLPAETMAHALPSRTSSAARTSEESFLRRTPPAGSSSMAMTSVQATSGSPMVSPTRSGGPTRATPTPCSSKARRAPSTTSAGALSPPTASTRDGERGERLRRWPLAPAAQVSRPRPLGDPCTSHSSGTPRAASWPPGSAGRRCAPAGTSRQAAAWWERPFALDFFFFGTAIDGSPGGVGRGAPGGRSRLPEHVEVSPPGVSRGNAAAFALVAVGAAHGAQAGAVVPAQRRHGKFEHDGVPRQRAEVDEVVDDGVAARRLARPGSRRAGPRSAPGPSTTSSPDTGSAQRRHIPAQGARTVPAASIPPWKGLSTRSTSAAAPGGTTLRPGSMPDASSGPASTTSPLRTTCIGSPPRGLRAERRSRATLTTKGSAPVTTGPGRRNRPPRPRPRRPLRPPRPGAPPAWPGRRAPSG